MQALELHQTHGALPEGLLTSLVNKCQKLKAFAQFQARGKAMSQEGALEHDFARVKITISQHKLMDAIRISGPTPEHAGCAKIAEKLGAAVRDALAAENVMLAASEEVARIRREHEEFRHLTCKQLDGTLSSFPEAPATAFPALPPAASYGELAASSGCPTLARVLKTVGGQQEVLEKSCPHINRKHEIKFNDNILLYQAVYRESLVPVMVQQPRLAEAVRAKVYYRNKRFLEAVAVPGLAPGARAELLQEFLPLHRY